MCLSFLSSVLLLFVIVLQEVNNPNSGYDECNENNSSSLDHGLSIHPALTEAITCMSTSMAEEQGW